MAEISASKLLYCKLGIHPVQLQLLLQMVHKWVKFTFISFLHYFADGGTEKG